MRSVLRTRPPIGALALLGLVLGLSACAGGEPAATDGGPAPDSGAGACGGSCPSGFTCDAAAKLCKNGGVPAFSHVFLIAMENTSYSQLVGDSTDAPYLNGTLFQKGVQLTKSYDAMVHPSLPNYLALVGGDNFGITDDGDALTYTVPANQQDLASQLEAAKLGWHEYSESETSPCELTDDANGLYVAKHNPLPHFLVTQKATADCAANDVSFEPEAGMAGLAADLAAGRLFAFSFISPNLCDDGHSFSRCTGTGAQNAIQQQDHWLATNVAALLASPGYDAHSLVVVTWDEGEQDGDHILTVLLSPMLASPGTPNGTRYSHYSTLATIEAGFGLANLPAQHGHGTKTDPLMTDLWQ